MCSVSSQGYNGRTLQRTLAFHVFYFHVIFIFIMLLIFVSASFIFLGLKKFQWNMNQKF